MRLGYTNQNNLYKMKILSSLTITILLTLMLSVPYLSCNDTIYSQGKALYDYNCANCHMENGAGLAGLIPPLADSDYLEKNRDLIPCIIRYGISDTLRVNEFLYEQPMAGIPQLNAVEINNIINYINHAWGNSLGKSRVQEVEKALKNCQ
jgi:mono/diheme cytochrome c family protein